MSTGQFDVQNLLQRSHYDFVVESSVGLFRRNPAV